MNTAYVKMMGDYTVQSLEQWRKLAETGFGIVGQLFQTQIEMADNLADIVANHVGNVFSARDAGEFASCHVAAVDESSKLLIDSAHSAAGIIAEAGKTCGKIFEESFQAGAVFAKPANAAKPQKSAA